MTRVNSMGGVAHASLLPVLLTLTVACGAPSTPSQPPPDAAKLRRGEALYEQYCALCHGDEGEGHAADNATRLNGQELLRTGSDRFLTVGIAAGRPGTAMAAYHRRRGGPLDTGQVAALVAFIRAWQTEPSLDVDALEVEGDAERGAGVYAAQCADCHGERAEGGPSAQSLDRPSFLSTVSDGFLRYAIEHGRRGTPMPAYGESLSAREIDDVVVFLRSLEASEDEADDAEEIPFDSLSLMRNPDGPTPDFELREDRFVPAAQVRAAVEAGARLILLDARPTSDWMTRRIVGALPAPYYDVDPILGRLPRDGTWIIAYCGCPHAASGRVVDALREAGYENTAVLDEGVLHWIREGYPTESGLPGD